MPEPCRNHLQSRSWSSTEGTALLMAATLAERCSTSGMGVQQEIHIPSGTKEVNVVPNNLHR